MDFLRTDDRRFQSLPAYDFAANYVAVDDSEGGRLRMHYVDAGNSRSDEVVLCLHGEPSWSYLYRKMIPSFVAAGQRVVAPDLSASAAPTSRPQRDRLHLSAARRLAAAACSSSSISRDITLVCQDWGGLIGLRLVAEHPERFAARRRRQHRSCRPATACPARRSCAWQQVLAGDARVPGRLTSSRGGCADRLDADESSPPMTRRFPTRPTRRARGSSRCWCRPRPTIRRRRRTGAAWEVLSAWNEAVPHRLQRQGPDHRAAPTRVLQQRIPGAQGQPHTTITGGGHFLQEDKGEELARVVVDFMKRT